jgi:hypothetical protein
MTGIEMTLLRELSNAVSGVTESTIKVSNIGIRGNFGQREVPSRFLTSDFVET